MNHMLSSGGQGEGKQDRIRAEVWIVKKVVAQECGTVRPVAYFGRGQMGMLIHRGCVSA